MQQHALPFTLSEDYSDAAFIVGEANKDAWNSVYLWPDWGVPSLIIQGPKGSGKTHLAMLWRERVEVSGSYCHWITPKSRTRLPALDELTGHIVLEDGDQLENLEWLFHVYNQARSQRRHLLITHTQPLEEWAASLPDLYSRLHSGLISRILFPDDTLLRQLLLKRFSDCQLRVPAEVLEYLVRRMERRFETVDYIITQLDQQAWQSQRAVSISMARICLEEKNRPEFALLKNH